MQNYDEKQYSAKAILRYVSGARFDAICRFFKDNAEILKPYFYEAP